LFPGRKKIEENDEQKRKGEKIGLDGKWPAICQKLRPPYSQLSLSLSIFLERTRKNEKMLKILPPLSDTPMNQPTSFL